MDWRSPDGIYQLERYASSSKHANGFFSAMVLVKDSSTGKLVLGTLQKNDGPLQRTKLQQMFCYLLS